MRLCRDRVYITLQRTIIIHTCEFICLSFSLSVFLTLSLFVCLSFSLSWLGGLSLHNAAEADNNTYMWVYLSLCLCFSICFSICLSFSLFSLCLFLLGGDGTWEELSIHNTLEADNNTYMWVYLFVCLSFCLSHSFSVCLFVFLSLSRSVGRAEFYIIWPRPIIILTCEKICLSVSFQVSL